MTFVPKDTEKNCFKACDQRDVENGLCDCVNQMKNKFKNLDTSGTGSGQLVVTKNGKEGRTYNNKPDIDGKVQVFCNDGTKLLCDVTSLTVKGFID